ncbi:Dbl homology domain-containing protein, partial [Choanephora cucurbitarum]
MKKTKHDILNISQSRFITMEEALSAEEEEEEEMFNKQLDAIEDQDKNEIKSLEQRRSIKRINAIKELMDTEETYSRDLGILCTHFFAIIQESSCISAEEIDVLVRNAMDIFSFQEKFMEALVDAHGTEEEKKNGICYKGNLKNIAACFVEWAPKFDIYLDYCVRQDHAASVYNELLQNNVEFSNLIERLHTFHRVSFGFSRLKFDDYMIIPFQRIFRYRLLLQTVTKATQKDSEEYELLSEAQNLIHAIASKINDEKSKMEAKRKTALFLSRLDSDWCLPKRWFSTLGVCSLIGTLEVRSNLDNKPKRIGCALFDHYMIMAKAKKHNQYEPRYWFPLRKFDIENLPNVEGTISYTWLLHSEDNTLELSAMCELEKNVWVEALTNAIRKSKRLYSKSVDSNEYLLEQLFVSSFDQHAQSRNTTSKHVDVCTALDPSVPIEYPMPSGSTSLSQSAIFNRQPNRSNHRASHPIFSSNQELPALELMPHPIDHGARSPGLRSQSSIGDLREFFSNSVSEKWSQRKFNQYHTRCKSVDTKFDDV